MSDINQVMNSIKEELEKGLPSQRKILSYLFDLLNKGKYPSLSDYEFYDIIGETYKLNLDYKLNLKMLFNPIYKAVRKRIKKFYGKGKIREMEQYLEKNYEFKSPEKQKIIDQSQASRTPLSPWRKFTIFVFIILLSVLLIITGLIIASGINPIVLIGVIVIICIIASIDYYCR
ncbi:MAG: hypothetical protein JSV62_03405 [Promethearchaeota archaeon]|nr:MAG: hypothetical protein JSV62_03405 [Candidatus Lokiarchaeota archaeon]